MPTRWGPVLLCGWPGLAGLWFRGRLSSLLLAVSFSLLLNVALVTSFIWPWSLGEVFPAIAWPMIFSVWGLSGIVAFRRLPDYMSIPASEKVAHPESPDTLFIHAQSEYLKGHWDEAEAILRRRLNQAPRDVEARLLLATLFRHTRQFEAARDEHREIEKFDESFEWRFEIEQEQNLLNQIQQLNDPIDSNESDRDTETSGNASCPDGADREH